MPSNNLLSRVSSRFSKSSTTFDERDSSGKPYRKSSSTKGSTEDGLQGLKSVSEQKSLGLTVLAEGKGKVIVDIVAIHGLNGHRERTFTAANNVLWLRDLLPADIPNARIMSYGYNVDIFDKDGHGLDQQRVYDHARGLISDLVLERQLTDTERRPIIFIAHSLGGIVVKAALIHSDSCRIGALESHHSIAVSTHGIFFMGTPHQGGSGVALANALVNIASVFVKAHSRILADLERDSQLLHTQLGQYSTISSAYVTKFAYETLPTPTLFNKSIMVVPISSAVVPGAVDAESIAIHANHRDMVRFTSNEDEGYQKVQKHLRLMIKDATEQTEAKWRVEDGKKRVQSGEMKKKSIVGLKDISSSFFVGRKRELTLLEQHLRASNTVTQRRCVIFGLGGAGKTEIAVHYALQHTDDFSAIFFVSAKDTQTLRSDYADIARLLGLAEALPQGANDVATDVAKHDAAIAAVKEWFTDQEDGDWLLIIDNADDLEGVAVQEFIPPTRKGHIILTSQDRRAASLGPSIEIDEMDQEDAEMLFLEKAKIKEPSKEQREICTEIVDRLGRLALAVEHAGAYVHDNDMALRLADYLVDLEKNRKRVLDESPQFSNHKHSILATYSMTKESLITRDMEALVLLTLLSCFDASGVPESLLLSSHTVDYFKEQKINYAFDLPKAKRTLLSFSLIRIRTNSDGQTAISLHSLLHQCVQTKLFPQNQWKWAHHAFSLYVVQTTNKTFQIGYFIHVRYCLRWLLERHKAPEMLGKPDVLIYKRAVFLMHHHQDLWRQAGLMGELHEFSCMCVQALEKETGNVEQAFLCSAMVAKAQSNPYVDVKAMTDDPFRDYLERQMRPESLAMVKRIESGSTPVSAFKTDARCLEDVFACPVDTPTMAQLIVGYAEEVAKGCISRNQLQLAEFYFTLKRLPHSRTWKSLMVIWWTWFCTYLIAIWTRSPRVAVMEDEMLIAARDRNAGRMDSTFTMLRRMVDDKSVPVMWVRAVYLLIKLLLKEGNMSEAGRLIKLVNKHVQDEPEGQIAMAYREVYVWLRKMEATWLIKQGHDHHAAAKQLLLDTLEDTTKIAGAKSLITLHTLLLLQLFHEQSCCFDEDIAKGYERRKQELSEYMYARSPTMVRRGEGYRMGLILLMQGELEEAMHVLDSVVQSAEKQLGADDQLTIEMRRMAGVARKEWIEETEEEKQGKVSIRRGSVLIWRDVSRL